MSEGGFVRAGRRSASSLSTTTARFDALSLGVSGADNRQAVVIEIGTKLTRIGFAGEFVPRSILRSELASECRKPLALFDSSTSPTEQYHTLVRFLKHIFFKHLLTMPKERRIVVVESVLCPTASREMLAKALFETFDAPSVLFAPSHLLATFPFGTQNALVVDVGFKETVALPILEGVTVLSGFEVSAVGGRRLEERALELLRRFGKVRSVDGGERKLNEADEALMKRCGTVEDLVVRFCFATKMERGLLIQASGYEESVTEGVRPPCEVCVPLGDEMLIVPGIVREWTAEVLFEYNDDDKSLPQIILDAVYRSSIDSRRTLLSNLIVIGGSASMNGFLSRLRAELLRLISSSEFEYASRLGKIDSVKFFRLENTPLELYANWLGGSMFGSVEILQYRSTSNEEWQTRKRLPDWTDKIAEQPPPHPSRLR